MTVDSEFETRNGNPRFLCRDGPARATGQPFSQKKLCFTSTERDLLARHLLLLSKRDTCYFVKFSVFPRGGMHLGRCFLTTDDAAARAWAEYKNHPSLYCTLQDDDFTHPYRDLTTLCDEIWLDDDRQSPEVAAAAARFEVPAVLPR